MCCHRLLLTRGSYGGPLQVSQPTTVATAAAALASASSATPSSGPLDGFTSILRRSPHHAAGGSQASVSVRGQQASTGGSGRMPASSLLSGLTAAATPRRSAAAGHTPRSLPGTLPGPGAAPSTQHNCKQEMHALRSQIVQVQLRIDQLVELRDRGKGIIS